MLSSSSATQPQPWYREFWAWFILSPLIVVVIACSITVTLAVRNADDPVVDNYYQQGRMINLRMDAQLQARALALSAKLAVEQGSGRLLISLSQSAGQQPEAIRLALSHPARAELDQSWLLNADAQGQYALVLPPRFRANRWYLRLDSVYQHQDIANWRLQGEIDFSQQLSAVLRADD